jgi:membrane-associated phospholipid phosphatase
LIYWEERVLRIVFIACSIIFAAIVLLAHLHYSIDVASAFFITYAIYHLCLQFFPGYKQIFDDEDAHPDLA